MKQKVLVNEIVSYCFDFKIIRKPVTATEIKEGISKQLGDIAFVENLYTILYRKGKDMKKLGDKRMIALLMELERLRLKLDHEGSNLKAEDK